jgi:hypothetical protein
LMYPFGWSWEKALPPELPRRPKGRKQGTRSLIRSRRRGPNTVCIFPPKLENVLENASACIHFGPHVATLGAKIRPHVSLGAFQKESEISSFFVTRLGAKLAQKDPLKWTE